MRWLRRIGLGVLGAVVVWILALAVLGRAMAGCQRDKAERRLADRLGADVTIGDLDLGLVTGAVAVDRLHIARDDGKLRLDVAEVDADVPPLGLALFHHGLGDITVRGVDATLAPGGLQLHGPKAPPLHVDSLELRDATLRLEGTTRLPLAIVVHVDRASAGPTTMSTALSWVFSLRTLEGHVDVPGGITFGVAYADQVAHLTLPGGRVLDVPLAIPPADPGNEKAQLRALGETLLDAVLHPR